MENYSPIKISYTTFVSTCGSNDMLAPVIFLHGCTSSKEMWGDIPQIIANKSKRKVYAYDARNHGESESTDYYNLDINVDDLFHFMDELNIKRAVLVGHSMGSFTATNAALRKPERFEMIFSEDMYIKKINKKVADSVIKFISDLSVAVQEVSKDTNESEAFSEAVEIFCKNNEGKVTPSAKESLKNSKRVLKRRKDGGYAVAFEKDPIIKAFEDPETLMRDPTGIFHGPIYFLYGGDSPYAVRSEETNIKKHFPKAKFIEFKGASHCFHLEFIDKFVETILDGLQQ